MMGLCDFYIYKARRLEFYRLSRLFLGRSRSGVIEERPAPWDMGVPGWRGPVKKKQSVVVSCLLTV